MNKDQLFEAFQELFPGWAKKATSYKKIGSKTLAINFAIYLNGEKVTEVSRVFLYVDPSNWQFGTKLWRKRPARTKKKNKELAFDGTERTEAMGR